MSVITCRSNVLNHLRSVPRNCQNDAQYNYVGGSSGPWQVTQMSGSPAISLASITHVEVIKGRLTSLPVDAQWVLSGLVRNTRYVSREEPIIAGPRFARALKPAAPCAALIAIRRSAEWWRLEQRVRSEILESRSFYITAGLHFLSGIVQRWQHRRDLSGQFDGVTWFEYEPRDSAAFEDILSNWRASEEWSYVDRECDIRLVRAGQ